MELTKYELLKTLPLGTDFKKAAPEGFETAWKAVKGNKDKPFGRDTSAAWMRIKEARLAEKTLKRLVRSNRITPEMADHVRGIPLDNVFAANRAICFALEEHVQGAGKNAFVPRDGFNAALAEYDLPTMIVEL